MVSCREIELKILADCTKNELDIIDAIAEMIVQNPKAIFQLSVKKAEEVDKPEQAT